MTGMPDIDTDNIRQSSTVNRNRLVRQLFMELRLSCSAIAQLRWEMLYDARLSETRRASAELQALWEVVHAQELAAGHGGPSDFVVRFRSGAIDLVGRANSVRRILRQRDTPAS